MAVEIEEQVLDEESESEFGEDGVSANVEILVDSTKQYFREIAQFPLLVAKEEVRLAQIIEKGKQAQAILDSGQVNGRSVQDYNDDVARGKKAHRRMMESNLRLVVSVAKKYLGRGLSLLDLIQEGNIGLSRGIDKFDWRRGYKLSTYATWWVRQGIVRGIIDKSRNVRHPVHFIEATTKIINRSRSLEQELGRDPALEELAEDLNMTASEVRWHLTNAQDEISLNLKIGNRDEGSMEIEDSLSPGDQSPDDQLTNQLRWEAINKARVKAEITDREWRVLVLRFGLEDNKCRTLEEVGRELGVTRERARQIEAQALRKFRNPRITRQLIDFLF